MEDDNINGNYFYIEEPPIEFQAYEKGKEKYGSFKMNTADADESFCADTSARD